MWISQKKFNEMQKDNELLQALENRKRPDLEYGISYIDDSQRKRYDEIVQSFQPKTVSFKDYYAERLEWWKKRFDKKPENHKLRIGWNDDFKIIEKNNMEAIEQTLNWFKKQKDFIEIEDFETNRKVVIPVNQIQDYAVIPGHPEPYTEEEIEAWAKEQLDQEMREWKVVKEERHCLTVQEKKMLEENERRQREYYQQMQNALRPINTHFVPGSPFAAYCLKSW